MSSNQLGDLPNYDVLSHVIDVHCHPTDSVIPASVMDSLPIRICAMATKESDQSLVRELALKWPDKVIPCFGYHPWFTHWIALEKPLSKEQHYRDLLLKTSLPQEHQMDVFKRLLPWLPEPLLLSDALAALRTNLSDFPNAMLGEVGLDRAFHIPILHPQDLDPNAQGVAFSNFTVPLDHQMRILEAQLQVAIQLRRNVSMHSVKSQQATLQLMDRLSNQYGEGWDMISLDLHSCGLRPEMWTSLQKSHPNIYLSLSIGINGRSRSLRDLIAACDPSRILAESDYHDIHASTGKTWDMINIIADVKGWQVEQDWNPDLAQENWGAIRRLEENWKTFSQGNHLEKRRELEARKRNRKNRKDVHWGTDEDAEL